MENGDIVMAKCATLIQLMKSCKSYQMPPCLRAAYVSNFLPIKWAEERVLSYAPYHKSQAVLKPDKCV